MTTEGPNAGHLSRRQLLRFTALGGLGMGVAAMLAACGAEAVPTAQAIATAAATNVPAGAGATVAAAATNPAAAATAVATTVAGGAPKTFSGNLTVWGIVSFTKAGDALLGQQMQDWGKANKVNVEYVPLPGSDFDTKLAGAVEAGATPDIAMMGGQNGIFYGAQNRLLDLTDILAPLKGMAGGMWPQLFDNVQSNGKTWAIPMQTDLSVMYARLDLCEQATGKRAAPTTLDEMEAIARKVTKAPTLYGIGVTLGRTPDGDGNIQQLILADGGTLVDKDGKPAINNPGTVSALTRVKKWWDDKLVPPDSTSWDDSKNNASYQSRQSAFVFNPASIFAYLDQNDKDLLKDTTQAPFPKGTAGSFPTVGTWAWSVFANSKNTDAAKAMISAIMAPDKMQAIYEQVGGRWYPVYKDLATAKFWKDRPYFDNFPDAITSARALWYPAQATPDLLNQLSATGQKRIYSEMVQDVVVTGKSPADAAKAAQTKMEQAFAEAVKR
jgi:multiple sugar transport system substrate-binding protein